MGFTSTPNDLVARELQQAEAGLGDPGHSWRTEERTLSDSDPDPANAGSATKKNRLSLKWLRQMLGFTPTQGVGDHLDSLERERTTADPATTIESLNQQLGLGWPDSERYRTALYKSMSLAKLGEVVGEGAEAIKDHWVISIAAVVVRAGLQLRANRQARRGNYAAAAALQLADMAFAFGPLAPHAKAWLTSVELAATTTDPDLAEAALDAAQLNYGKLVVNVALLGLTALPRRTSTPNAIKDITPDKLARALQSAMTSSSPTQLQTIASARDLPRWLKLLGGLTPPFQVASAAAGTGDLGGLTVLLQEGIGNGDSTGHGPSGNADSQTSLEGLIPFRALSAAEQESVRTLSASFHPPLTRGHWNTISEHYRQLLGSGQLPDNTFLIRELATIHIDRSETHFEAVRATISNFEISSTESLSQILRSPIIMAWSSDIGLTEKLMTLLPANSFEFKRLVSQRLAWSTEGPQFTHFERKIANYLDARLKSAGLNDALSERLLDEVIGLQELVHALPKSGLAQSLLALLDKPLSELGLFFHQGFDTGYSDEASPEPPVPASSKDVPAERLDIGASPFDLHAITSLKDRVQNIITSASTETELATAQQAFLDEKKNIVGLVVRHLHSHPDQRSKVYRELDRLGEAIATLGDKIRYFKMRKPLTLEELKKKSPQTLIAVVNKTKQELPVSQLQLSDNGPSFVVAGNNPYYLDEVKLYDVWTPSHEP